MTINKGVIKLYASQRFTDALFVDALFRGASLNPCGGVEVLPD